MYIFVMVYVNIIICNQQLIYHAISMLTHHVHCIHMILRNDFLVKIIYAIFTIGLTLSSHYVEMNSYYTSVIPYLLFGSYQES